MAEKVKFVVEEEEEKEEKDEEERVEKGRSVELYDVVKQAVTPIIFWLVVAVTTVGVILSWLQENVCHHVLELCNAFYTGVSEAVVIIVHSVAASDRLQASSVWTYMAVHHHRGREICLRLVYLPCGLLHRAIHRLYNFYIGKLQANCPAFIYTFSVWGSAASEICLHLMSRVRSVVRLGVACVHHVWSVLVWTSVCCGQGVWRIIEYMWASSLPVFQYCRVGVVTARACVHVWTRPEVEVGASPGHESCPTHSQHGTRLVKKSLRCLTSMSVWRTLTWTRCNPRVAFTAIVVCVTFTCVLTVYLYSQGGVKVRVAELTGRLGHEEGELIGMARNGEGQKKDTERYLVKKVPGPKENGRNMKKKRKKKKKEEEEEEEELNPHNSKQVSDVISLLSKFRSTNKTSRPQIHKELLERQIGVLSEAMLSTKSMLPRLLEPPACVGDLRPGEVEDVLCIPRPKFLSHIKNPCWYEASSEAEGQGQPSLRCLPYFHILGCAKAGTTDLWNRLMSHPHVISNDGLLHKEALWWSWRRYGFSGYKRRQPMNFTDYVDLFQDTARLVQTSIDNDNVYQQILITGDASPPDFWDFRGWVNISQNRDASTPQVITPHLMQHFYPNPKFILMFRDPIDRLYSDYFFVGGGLTSLDFHNDVLATIDMLARCVEKRGLQQCFQNHTLYLQLPVRLPYACYSVFMREWLQVFSLDNFLFLKTEEYEENPEVTLKSVMEFLGLGPLKEATLQQIAEEEKSRITMQKQIAGPMHNMTRDILRQLLDPCSQQLASMIKMDKFTWNYS